MHKLTKNNKRGFTLLEIVIVVAIISIIAAVLAINASDIYNRSHNKTVQVTGEVVSVKGGIADSESVLSGSYHF